MSPADRPHEARPDRRRALALGAGAAGLGLFAAWRLALRSDPSVFAGPPLGAGAGAARSLAPRAPHFAPRAKRVLFLFMTGGPSQMDLFDHKPELQKRSGQTVDIERRRGQTRGARLLGSRRTFRQHGETGQWCSDAFTHIPRHMDKLAVVKSLYTDSFAHGSALLQMNSGQFLQGHPAMGAWVNYGLGSESPDLPGFVVMHDPRGGPISGAANWTSGYMPAAYQGTLFRPQGDPLPDLSPAPETLRAATTRDMQRAQVELVAHLDGLHSAARPGMSELTARAATYDLALRMQEIAPDVLDLSTEDERTLEMYGLFDPKPEHRLSIGPAPFGRQCLVARRLLERGVRFVQIYHGGGHQQQTWDAHHGVEENLAIHCPEVDRPIAGLLEDLDRSGLLEDTLVIWGGEFGRQPTSQQAGDGQIESDGGRDHNPKAITMWLAGAGVRPGSYGETDELGAEAARDVHHVRDLHATVLHLLGLDYARLTYPYGGLDRKLTGVVEPRLIDGLLG